MSHSYQLLARPKNDPNPFLADHLATVSKSSQAIFSQASLLIDTSDHLGLDFHDFSISCKLIGGGHDVGKATKYFQEYIQNQKTDRLLKAHSPLSSFYVYSSYPTVLGESKSEINSGKLLRWLSLTIVLNHHGVLRSPPQTFSVLREWLMNKLHIQISAINENAKSELNSVLQGLNLPVFPDFHEIKHSFRDLVKDIGSINNYSKKHGFASFYLGNLLFSALIDADRMDAAGVEPAPRRDMNAQIVKKYVERISIDCEQNGFVDPERLQMRQRLFSEIAQKAKTISLNKRIFSLTAPTGCGKTLAGIYFALILRERLQASKRTCPPRIIYVAPFLSILDQNFEVFREAFQIPKELKQTEILLKHHHLSELSYKVLQGLETETYSSVESEVLVEGWNAEIIVTTFVQFLYTILGARASQLRKLHNLMGSIVILDEVQCIPAKWWPLVRESIKFLAHKFKTYFILMTATQPLIFETGEVEELVENRDHYFRKKYVRLQPHLMQRINIDEFIKKIVERIKDERKSTMILMNTIDSATYLYKALNKSPLPNIPFEYLSAELLPLHRREKLSSICARLRNGEPLVLVTTQVVEAGVNLDFDMVVRDMGPVDSIIQAAGRCNREGRKDPSKSLVEIFEVCDQRGTFCRKIYGDFAIDKTNNAFKKWAPEDDFSKLAMQFYRETREGLSTEESRKILEGLKRLDYEKLDEFAVIEEAPSRSVFIEWDKNAMEIWKEFESLSSQINPKQKREKFLEIKKELYDHVINVPEKFVSGISQNAGFWYIAHDQVEKFYSKSTGFKRELPSSII